ncbi:MAG: SpoIIE family protein phosphatase [Clostridia bacterium]|nr:SpoIIE family protein phosphatase [Clostridia bacterium]MBO7216917.1 SpoIIE family protein phosphatase [Clostridia bacterium]MBO7246271.1 SpoIIE family protein phosphatase [Clostridia bacterium]MBO7737493.1 SpoIIE family protein phosphatase [Clostridia bacterium]MBQ5841958.1 SpoIIE family protein phosphatase [Clostridia bacterium]
MNDLCADIGYKSINHFGEQLCGDHVDIVEPGDNSTVVVLSDGLGSGVKASILSTLTSKIISTMLSEGLSLEECVETIAATLPVCSVRGVAYSTFTIIHLKNNQSAELIQYDNPHAIIIRDEQVWDYPKTEMNIGGKKIYKSVIKLQENDIFVAMSDGCPHAGIGITYNFGWKRENIAEFMQTLSHAGYTAKTLSTMLVDECDKLYGFQPGDDATACVVRIRKREPMNMLFGPPSNRDDADRMMSLFFSKEGKHIICGGTTSSIAAKFLRKPLRASLNFEMGDIPPIAEIEGVDLVTEGVITVNKVLEYAKDYLGENKYYSHWSYKRDGASLICRLLFEEATDINFYVGRAVNPAHQNPDLPINFNIKMNLVEELSACLKKMGKRIKVSYF